MLEVSCRDGFSSHVLCEVVEARGVQWVPDAAIVSSLGDVLCVPAHRTDGMAAAVHQTPLQHCVHDEF